MILQNNLAIPFPMRTVKDFGPSDTVITSKVPSRLVGRLEEIAKLEERSRSSVIKMLIVRGLKLYEEDGELRDIVRPEDEQFPNVNKVAGHITSEKAEKERLRREYIEQGVKVKPSGKKLPLINPEALTERHRKAK